MTKAQVKEQQEAIAQLREWIKPGDTVYTILDHVSSSGMSRHIRVLVPLVNGKNGNSTVDFIHPNWAVGKALQIRHARRNGREQDALLIGGCGMDMGFHLVYQLSHALYGEGYQCLGEGKCPSNYHSNHHDTVRCPNHCFLEEGKRYYWNEVNDQRFRDLCKSCKNGRIPNPDGPERFDLVHKDGYALKHRWM